jgi:hypothetical protein
MTETTEQIVREAPQVEAYKLGLLASAKDLADRGIQIPQQMVAEMSALQVKGTDLTELGIGGYQPYLTEAGYTLGDAQNTIGQLQTGVTTTGEGVDQVTQFDNPFLRDARRLMLNTTGGDVTVDAQGNQINRGIPGVIDDSNKALALAQEQSNRNAKAGIESLRNAAGQAPGIINTSEAGLADAQAKANAANLLSQNTDAREIQRFQLNEATEAGRTTADNAAVGGVGAYQTAADDLTGLTAAARAVAGQARTDAGAATGAYNPSAVSPFMGAYEDEAVQRALADIRRAGDIQQQAVGAQAANSGAFGGSRQAIAESELDRNVLDQQARTAAAMRQQGYQLSSQQAQQAFEAQQGRRLQAAQLASSTGLNAEQLGQSGAVSSGQLGLSAFNQQGQLGLSSEQMAAANSQALAQTGMSLQQLGVQTGMSTAQLLGQLTGQQAQTAQANYGQQGQLSQQAAALGMGDAAYQSQLAGQSGSMGIQGQELMSRVGEGLGSLGTQYGQLGLAKADAQSQLGLRQAALGELGQTLNQKEAGFVYDVGKQQQGQQQAELEAERQSKMAQLYEPYQRVGFLSDIYKGAPTTQQSITAATAPSTSPAQQILGLGVAGLSAAAGASKAGLF